MTKNINTDYDRLKQTLDTKENTFKVERDSSETKVTHEFIKDLRDSLGYSQEVFSTIVGVSEETIMAWELNQEEPSLPEKKMLYLFHMKPSIIKYLYKIRKS